jgi:hypothetical protein
MRNKIVSGWNTMRVIRLIIGIAILAEGIHSRDTSLIIGGLVVSALPFFNVGCCCGNTCEVPRSAESKHETTMQEK